MTDSDLLRRFVEERHEDAFSELVRRRIDLVYAAALRQLGGDSHRAQDITQQVFIDLARKAPTLTSHPSLLAWLYTSTHYAVRKFIRTENRRQRREEEAHAMENLTASSGRTADWEQLRPVLDRAMHELSDRERRIVLLRFFDQQSFAAIGAALGLSENAAQKSAERALDRLHALLAKRGVTSTASAVGAALVNQAAATAPAGLASSVASVAVAQAAMIGAPATALTAIVTLMNTSKVTWGLATILITCAGGGAYFSLQAARAEARLASVQDETGQLLRRARVAAHTDSGSPAASPAPASVAPAAGEDDAVSQPTAVPPLSPEQRLARAAAVDALISDPRFNEIKIQFGATYLSGEWALFCQALGLTAGQRAQFQSLLGDALAEAWRVRMDARRTGRTEKDPVVAELLGQARGRLEESLKAMLGEGGLRRFLDYEANGRVQQMTAVLAQRLYFSESPLTPQQAVQLTELIVQARRKAPNAGMDEALAVADSFLTPRQVRAFEVMRIERDFSRERTAVLKTAVEGRAK